MFSTSLAQENDFEIESHISKIIQQGDEAENRRYYDLLLYFYDTPIDINHTNAEELAQLGILSTYQINEILTHIVNTGDFRSIYELQVLTGFSRQDIKNIAPFITINKNESLGKAVQGLFNGRTTNYATLGYSRVTQQAKAYTDKIYFGSPDRAQMRVRLRNPGHLSIGLSAQKDPGETWLTNTSVPTPDYLSGHIFLENQGRLKQLVLGDYRLQFGQGLVLGAGFMVGKNVETVTSVKQSTLGVLPYSSITESNFFRGTAISLKLAKPVKITMFYSNQYLDATVINNNAIASIRTSGLRRSITEINARNQLHAQAWGSALTYDAKRFATGLLLVNTQFNKAVIPPDRDYNKYKFTGNNQLNYSWFGQYNLGNFLIFSEVAKTYSAGMGVNLGIIGSVSKYVSLSLLYRSFTADFQSLYGMAFAERGTVDNESGMYWGIKLYPLPGITLSAYYDMYRFPWITFSTAGPANGKDYLIRLKYEINESANMFIQLRNEDAQKRESTGNIYMNTPVKILKTILNFDYNLESPVTFRSRIQYNRYHEGEVENGWLMYQDVNYTGIKVGFTGRVLLFDTDSFNARQYAYEKDMLFTYNTRVFNGKGISYYFIMKYKPYRSLSLRLKWSYIEYAGQKTIGSGNDLIQGNQKTQITGQLHYTF
jgi:hypothetical protein